MTDRFSSYLSQPRRSEDKFREDHAASRFRALDQVETQSDQLELIRRHLDAARQHLASAVAGLDFSKGELDALEEGLNLSHDALSDLEGKAAREADDAAVSAEEVRVADRGWHNSRVL